jgi:hypothetical protein
MMTTSFNLSVKWPNGTRKFAEDPEEERGPGDVLKAFRWTIDDMTIRTALKDEGLPSVITVSTCGKTETCKLTGKEINDD